MSDPGRSAFSGNKPSEEGNGGKLPPISFFSSSLPPLKTDIPELSFYGSTSYASPNKSFPSPQMMCSPVMPNVSIAFPTSVNSLPPRSYTIQDDLEGNMQKKPINSSNIQSSSTNNPLLSNQNVRLSSVNKEPMRDFESVPNSPHLFPACLPSPKSVPNLGDSSHPRSMIGDHSYQKSDRPQENFLNTLDDFQEVETFVLNSLQSLDQEKNKKSTQPTSESSFDAETIAIPIVPKEPKKITKNNTRKNEPKAKASPRKTKNALPMQRNLDEQQHASRVKEPKSSLLVNLLTTGDDYTNLVNDPYKVNSLEQTPHELPQNSIVNKITDIPKKLPVKTSNDFHAIIEHKPLPPIAPRRSTPSSIMHLGNIIPYSSKPPKAQNGPMDHSNKLHHVIQNRNFNNSARMSPTVREVIQDMAVSDPYGMLHAPSRIPMQPPVQRTDNYSQQSLLLSNSNIMKHNNQDDSQINVSPGSSESLHHEMLWSHHMHNLQQPVIDKGFDTRIQSNYTVPNMCYPADEILYADHTSRSAVGLPYLPDRLNKILPRMNDIQEETAEGPRKDTNIYKTIIDYLVKENEEYRTEVSRLQSKLNGLQGEITTLMRELSKMINASDDSDSSQETIIDEPKRLKKTTTRRKRKEKLDSAEASRSLTPDSLFSPADIKPRAPRRRGGPGRGKKSFARPSRKQGKSVVRKKESPMHDDETEAEEAKIIAEYNRNDESSPTLQKSKRTRQRRKNSSDAVGNSEAKRRKVKPKQRDSSTEDNIGITSKIDDMLGDNDRDKSPELGDDQPKTRRSSRRTVRNRFLSPTDDTSLIDKPSTGSMKESTRSNDLESPSSVGLDESAELNIASPSSEHEFPEPKPEN